MKAHRKTKQVQKELKKAQKKSSGNQEENQGEPQLKSLSDFVTALTPVFASKPIYTGGRILTAQGRVYASCNQEIAVYDLASRSSLARVKHTNEEIVNFTVNLTGSRIATFSENGLLRIVDLQSLKVLQITKLNSKLFPNDLAFSPDSRHLALGFASQAVKIYSVETLKETHSYQHAAPVRKVEWHPNSELLQLVSSDDSRKLIIFDYIVNKAVGQIEGGHTFNFLEGGKKIVTICNQEIRVYEYKGLKLIQTCVVNQYLEGLYAFGDNVFFGGEETELLVWKVGDDKIKPIRGGTEKGVMKILGLQKEKKCLVVSTEQNLTIVDCRTFDPEDMIVGYNDEIIDIKYSKAAESDYFLLITNSSNAKIMNRHTNTFHCLVQGHTDIILCGEYWHPFLATAGKDKTIKLWKLNETGKPRLIANYRGHSDDVCGIGWLPKSHLLVSVGEDKTIKIWSIIEAGSDSIQISSALTTVMGHEKTINAVRVSAKEELIATCSHDRTVKVWDKDLRNLFTLAGHRRGVWDAAFHEKEAVLVTAGGDGMLKGWSMIDGSCIWSMGEGSGLVRCQWIYEHQVVTSSVDGILKIWDVRKKTSLSYDKHEGKIWALEVRKNEKGKCEIATGANDSVYQIWVDSTEQTRDRIMKQGELDQKERILLEQFRFEKQYLEAAKVAFDGNYSQMFMQVLHEMLGGFDESKQVQMDQDGRITQEPQLPDEEKVTSDLKELIQYTLERDASRLLNLVLTMNSTVRHFKTANRLLLEILKVKKLRGMLEYDHSFSLLQSRDDLIDKETDFEKFLRNMQLYTEKHYQRIERYIRGSYWIDQMREQQNPMDLEKQKQQKSSSAIESKIFLQVTAMTMNEDRLPPNFAEKVLELESLLDDHRSMDLITDLNELYRIGIDYYVRYEPRKAQYFQKKMTRLLADHVTLTLIENKSPDKNHLMRSPQLAVKSKIKEEMSKFNSREEEYVKNILEQSQKTLKKNEKLKNIDLNKQEQNLQNRLKLKKYKSQEKFMILKGIDAQRM